MGLLKLLLGSAGRESAWLVGALLFPFIVHREFKMQEELGSVCGFSWWKTCRDFTQLFCSEEGSDAQRNGASSGPSSHQISPLALPQNGGTDR